MLKHKKKKSFGFVLLLIFLICGSFTYGLVGGFGSPENSSRLLDGPNGVGSACVPPGSLCRHVP